MARILLVIFLKRNKLYNIKNICLLVFGTLIISFATAVFILPNSLVVGGVSGISVVLSNILKINTEILVFIITWLMFILSFFFLGKNFTLKSLISSILFPFGVSFFGRIINSSFFSAYLNITSANYSEISILLSAIFGGVLIGIGLSLSFFGGGSTGGVDILAFIISKKIPKIKTSTAIFIIDAIIIILGIFVIKDLTISLLGVTSAFISAQVIDRLFLSDSKAFIAQIVTSKHLEINRDITNTLKRTSSIINILGGYSMKENKMLLVTFSYNQYNDLIRIIKKNDPKAFVMVIRGHEIYGPRWKKYNK